MYTNWIRELFWTRHCYHNTKWTHVRSGTPGNSNHIGQCCYRNNCSQRMNNTAISQMKTKQCTLLLMFFSSFVAVPLSGTMGPASFFSFTADTNLSQESTYSSHNLVLVLHSHWSCAPSTYISLRTSIIRKLKYPILVGNIWYPTLLSNSVYYFFFARTKNVHTCRISIYVRMTRVGPSSILFCVEIRFFFLYDC